MARYNRDFLVPYLHDLCALYLAERKLESNIANTMENIKSCSHEHWPKPPREPEGMSIPGWVWFALIFGGFWIVAGHFMVFEIIGGDSLRTEQIGFAWTMSLFALFFLGATPLYFGIREYRWEVEFDKKHKRDYEILLERYAEDLKQAYLDNEHKANQLPILENQLREQKAELEKLRDVRRFVYGANIIPTHYRNFYATVFLYDWFAYGSSDDLDMALNTFVLEEIKDRLDRIIEQQSEMILNQRKMLAKQQESIDAQDQHNNMMRQKLDQLQATEDERLRYERMAETNTAATAYFTAATYLKS